MNKEILGIVVIYIGIAAIATFARKYVRRRVLGILGLIFTVQPVAMATYREMDPWPVLILVVTGVVLLLLATRGSS